MDVFADVLTGPERQDEMYARIVACVEQRRAFWINKLINSQDEKESDKIRGRIEELRVLISPPAITPTAQVDPRASADQEGFHVR